MLELDRDIVLKDVESVKISEFEVVIKTRSGDVYVVKPDYYDEIELCREATAFYDCVEENIKLRIERVRTQAD